MSLKSTLTFSFGIVIGALGMYALALNGHGSADCPGSKGTPCANGDVNGDGGLDIADAIYLLSHLFADGPEPVPIECPPSSLPATGQSRCYDTWGNELDCSDTDFPGQDGFYQAGCSGEDRFTDNGNGTVSDQCTGLMWTKTATAERISWQEALHYCEALEEGGYDDWRLPNALELISLATMDSALPALSFQPIFQFPPDLGDPFNPDDYPQWRCWTSSTDVRNHMRAAYVTPIGPTILSSAKTELYRVFGVRDD